MDVLEPRDPSARREPESWRGDYLSSLAYRTYVGSWQAELTPRPALDKAPRKAARRSAIRDLGQLVRRYALRKSRDRWTLAIQLLQAPVIALLTGWLFDKAPDFGLGLPKLCVLSDVLPALFMLGAASMWFGCTNVARELVGDRPVFLRERMVGLSPTAYLLSVFTVQLALAALQTLILAAITWPLVGLAGASFLPAWGLLTATAAFGLGMGLLCSSLARSEVAAISAIPLILLPQLMFSGYLQLFRTMTDLQQIATAISPMRWVFEGLLRAEYAAAGRVGVIEVCVGFPERSVLMAAGVLVVGATALIAATGWQLARTTAAR